jgi:hypothetical protein
MANVKITDLTELSAQPSTDDYFVIVDSSEALDADKTKKINFGNVVKDYVDSMSHVTYLSTALSSTDWTGNSFGTTPKTKIDLSAVFGAPANVEAVYCAGSIRDSGSAGTDCNLILSANDVDGQGFRVTATPVDDRLTGYSIFVPCSTDGDIYYQTATSSTDSMDIFLRIWGYTL